MYCSSWIPPYLIWKVLWCLLLIVCEQSPWNDCFLGDGYLLFFLKLCSRHLLKFLQNDKKLDTFRLDLCHNISHPVCRSIGTATLIQSRRNSKGMIKRPRQAQLRACPSLAITGTDENLVKWWCTADIAMVPYITWCLLHSCLENGQLFAASQGSTRGYLFSGGAQEDISVTWQRSSIFLLFSFFLVLSMEALNIYQKWISSALFPYMRNAWKVLSKCSGSYIG